MLHTKVDRAANTPHGTEYRPDIDGLRAIAVLTVLLFHADIPGFSGGFVGVDIFFVISGYLITSIIHAEMMAGKFSIARFYERRVRRLIPALLALVAFCIAIGSALLLPADLDSLAKSALATLAFSSNIFFWRTTGYFDGPADYKPLLHTWSLGIEEQFYIIFPLILAATVRFIPRYVLGVIVGIAATSFALSVAGLALNKAAPTFYLLPFRAWELALGAMIALGATPTLTSKTARTTCAAIGLACVAWAVVAYHSSMPFPGQYALLPCIGAALIISAGIHGSHHLTPVMTARPLVWVGLISYSLYLLHWPILVFLRYYLVRDLTHLEAVSALLAALLLAALSTRYVERPFRDRSMSVGHLYRFAGGGVLLIAAAGSALVGLNGLPQRFSRDVASINAAAGTIYKCGVTDYILFANYYACPLNLPTRKPSDAQVVLWGDSHAQMYAPALIPALRQHDRTGLLVPLTGCPPTADLSARIDCARINAANFRAIAALPRAQTVVLGLRWQGYENGTFVDADGRTARGAGYAVILRELERTVDQLVKAGKSVVVIGPLALPTYDVPSVMSRTIAFDRQSTEPTGVARAEFLAEVAPVLSRLRELDRRPGVDVAYVHERQCDGSWCPFVRGGQALFADDNHISSTYARSLDVAFSAVLGSASPR